MTQNIDTVSQANLMPSTNDEKRSSAIKASRTMLLMQWPVYTVLGLIGILLPILGSVDEVALIGTILLISAMTQVVILLKYGINPGFVWRFSLTVITIVACILVLTGALVNYFSIEQIVGGYLLKRIDFIIVI